MEKAVTNMKDCLYSKVRSYYPSVKQPKIEIDFGIIETSNSEGIPTLHLVARDRINPDAYIYLAEVLGATNDWVAKESEFFTKIYLFPRHIVELVQLEGEGLSVGEQGSLLVKIATRELEKFTPTV